MFGYTTYVLLVGGTILIPIELMRGQSPGIRSLAYIEREFVYAHFDSITGLSYEQFMQLDT